MSLELRNVTKELSMVVARRTEQILRAALATRGIHPDELTRDRCVLHRVPNGVRYTVDSEPLVDIHDPKITVKDNTTSVKVDFELL